MPTQMVEIATLTCSLDWLKWNEYVCRSEVIRVFHRHASMFPPIDFALSLEVCLACWLRVPASFRDDVLECHQAVLAGRLVAVRRVIIFRARLARP